MYCFLCKKELMNKSSGAGVCIDCIHHVYNLEIENERLKKENQNIINDTSFFSHFEGETDEN